MSTPVAKPDKIVHEPTKVVTGEERGTPSADGAEMRRIDLGLEDYRTRRKLRQYLAGGGKINDREGRRKPGKRTVDKESGVIKIGLYINLKGNLGDRVSVKTITSGSKMTARST